MDLNIPLKGINIEENKIFNKRKELFEDLDEINIINEKNNLKLSLRKKKNAEYLNDIRQKRLKKLKLYLKENSNHINYDELINLIPKEIITEFETTKNKYNFYITFLNITEKEDPNFYIRMFVIYQIRIFLNNDIKNNSFPSNELLNSLLKLLLYEYTNEQINQKIKIQSEIIEILIILMSYNDIDNTNSVLYDEHFLFFLIDMLENVIYNIEFKINIFVLFNVMIKGPNTFNKIIFKCKLINKIENILSQINKDEQYIYILRLIFNIFDKLIEKENDDEEKMEEEIIPSYEEIKNYNLILFENTYDKLLILFNHYYEQYQKKYEELKNDNIPISMDSKIGNYYKIIIKLLKIINTSLLIEENITYINIIINNETSISMFLKILEIFSKEFFLSLNLNDNINMKINNNISLITNNSLKLNEKNNLYKKIKTIIYITHILTEIISSSDDKEAFPNFKNVYDTKMNLIMNYNIINYYSNLIKNFVCFNINPDYNLILRIEEFIYNFCEINKNNYFLVYKNYELIRELLLINQKNYNEDNLLLLIKFIINSISLYETEITRSIIFEIKIISIFLKFLENETETKEKMKSIKFILYALNSIIDSNTYRKCKLNRNLIIYEFNKNNANEILGKYAMILVDNDLYDIVNSILNNLDESDLLDNNELEELYNPSNY